MTDNMLRLTLGLLVLCIGTQLRPLLAQCPDGSPPPCRVSRVAALLRDLPPTGPLEMWTGSGLATTLWQLGDRQGARAVLERVLWVR